MAAGGGGAVKMVTSKAQLDTIIGEGAPAVLMSGGSSLDSKYIDPVFSNLSTEFPLVRFLRVNSTEHPEVADEYLIYTDPYFLFIKNGKVVDILEGAYPSTLANKVAKVSRPIRPAEPASLGMAAKKVVAENVENRLKQLMNSSPVMLFMKGTPDDPKCGLSSKVVNALKEEGVTFRSFDILTDDEVTQGLKTYWPYCPQLYYKGKLIGGSDIVLELRNYGELKTTLSE